MPLVPLRRVLAAFGRAPLFDVLSLYCALAHSPCRQRILSVLSASIANPSPTIQKRITTFVSGQPSFSKW